MENLLCYCSIILRDFKSVFCNLHILLQFGTIYYDSEVDAILFDSYILTQLMLTEILINNEAQETAINSTPTPIFHFVPHNFGNSRSFLKNGVNFFTTFCVINCIKLYVLV